MSARRQLVSAPIRRKDGRGRPSTPFLRERILESAAELFAEKEFDLVLIDEVAAHAGIGKGSVYRQFKSKEELYAAVVINGFAALQREIRSALSGATTMRAQIAAIVRHTLKFFWTRRQFFALLRDPKALPRSQERQYRTQRTDFSRLISGVLDDGVKRGAIRSDLDTQIAAESLLGMMRGINRYSRDYTSPDRATDIVTSIFLGGCEAR
jgi:AcrR family transcriptional regulator